MTLENVRPSEKIDMNGEWLASNQLCAFVMVVGMGLCHDSSAHDGQGREPGMNKNEKSE